MTKIRYLAVQKINCDDSQKAETNLSASFLQTLTPPYLPQKKIKNLILKEQLNLSETDLQTANQLHKRESDFFSASYSGEWLLLGISKEKIGLDLEIIKPRDESLLKTYKVELETHFWTADWNTFYLLRTAKEAILKASDSENLDRLTEITILSAKKQTQTIGNLPFTWTIYCSFQGENRLVYSHENDELARSLCIKKEL